MLTKLQEIGRRIWHRLNRRRWEETLRSEMEAHRELLANPARFGNTLQLREKSRDVWGWNWLDDILRDLRFATRSIIRSPGFSLTVILTLALGFFLSISTFAVVNTYMIRSLPYPEADRLYHVIYAPQGRPEPGGMSKLDWRELSDVVELADSSLQTRLFVYDGPVRREGLGLSVSQGSMELLGISAVAGRSLEAADFQSQSETVAIVSATWWQAQFGSDRPILGSSFRASRSNLAEPDQAFRVVGVLPPEFRYARETNRGPMAFVVPLSTAAQSYFVRLRAGVPVSFAEKRLTETAKRIATSMPPQWPGVRLESARERYIAGVRPMLTAIAAASGAVLLTVCVNIAVLMLLRALRRQKEVALRVALGAGKWQILRMLTAESLLLSGMGLVGGLYLTKVALQLLGPMIEERLGLQAPGGPKAIGLDATVLAVTVTCSLLIAVVFSFVPMLAPWQTRLAESIQKGSRGGTSNGSSSWARFSLVSLEIAASLALLVGSGLMIRTVLVMVGTDLGIRTAGVVRARVALPARTYSDAESFRRFHARLNQRLSTEPVPFALSNFIPFYETPKQTMEVEPGQGAKQRPGLLAVSESYFSLFEIKVMQGRGFSARDREGSEPVAIVSESLARRTWRNENALGKRIRTAEQPVPDSPLTVWRTVVGVARDVRQTHTDEDLSDLYIPLDQAPSRYTQLFLKTKDPVQVLKNVEGISAAIDPQVQVSTNISGVATLDAEASRLLAGPRFLMSLLTGFAGFALLLSVLGIYGVSAFAAREREHEVAIRMAIGASRRDIILMFVREGLVVLFTGVVTGSLGAAAVGSLLSKQIYGVEPFDLATVMAAGALISTAGLTAIWWPAWQAATQSPLRALKQV